MTQEQAYTQAIALIENANNVLITTHMKPDGDACGCIAVVSAILRNLGKTARPLLLSPMPQWYGFLFDEPVPVLGHNVQVEDLTSGAFGQVDLIIIVDTNSVSQLPRCCPALRNTSSRPRRPCWCSTITSPPTDWGRWKSRTRRPLPPAWSCSISSSTPAGPSHPRSPRPCS